VFELRLFHELFNGGAACQLPFAAFKERVQVIKTDRAPFIAVAVKGFQSKSAAGTNRPFRRSHASACQVRRHYFCNTSRRRVVSVSSLARLHDKNRSRHAANDVTAASKLSNAARWRFLGSRLARVRHDAQCRGSSPVAARTTNLQQACCIIPCLSSRASR